MLDFLSLIFLGSQYIDVLLRCQTSWHTLSQTGFLLGAYVRGCITIISDTMQIAGIEIVCGATEFCRFTSFGL